jgi:hypothetical protein
MSVSSMWETPVRMNDPICGQVIGCISTALMHWRIGIWRETRDE